MMCRGSVLVSRLASYYPERFKAYAFLAIGYSATFAGFEYEAFLASIKQAVGYETYGYWECAHYSNCVTPSDSLQVLR